MPFDLALDENFDVFISHRGDLATVEGRDRFEQEIIVRLTNRMGGMIGKVDDDSVKNVARIHARRVAAETNNLSAIADFEAKFSDEKPETLQITLFYDTGEELTFEVEG